jgi:hypothetical protein
MTTQEKILINRPHLETYKDAIVIQKGKPDFKFRMKTGSVEIIGTHCIHRNAQGQITLMKQLPVICRLVSDEPKGLFIKIKEWMFN